MTTPLGDITVDIPKQSILTVEGQIVTGKSKELLELLHSSVVDVDPLSERIVMKLPKPSLDDNISDLERLKRELFSNGLGCLRVPSRFMSKLARTVREKDWEITLSTILSDDCYEITNIFPGNCKVPNYGIAVDIGTTTLAVFLIDLVPHVDVVSRRLPGNAGLVPALHEINHLRRIGVVRKPFASGCGHPQELFLHGEALVDRGGQGVHDDVEFGDPGGLLSCRRADWKMGEFEGDVRAGRGEESE